MEKEWRVVRRRRDIQRIRANQILVPATRGDRFEFRALGKMRRQHRHKFHLIRDLNDSIDLLIREWTLGNQNCRDAVLSDLGIVLLTNDHDVLARIRHTHIQ